MIYEIHWYCGMIKENLRRMLARAHLCHARSTYPTPLQTTEHLLAAAGAFCDTILQGCVQGRAKAGHGKCALDTVLFMLNLSQPQNNHFLFCLHI